MRRVLGESAGWCYVAGQADTLLVCSMSMGHNDITGILYDRDEDQTVDMMLESE